MNYLQFCFFLFLFLWSTQIWAQETFDKNKMQRLDLEFYDQHWNNKLKAFKKQKLETRLPAKLTLAGVSYDSVAVRFKGNSSYNNPSKKESKKLPFNIDLNEFVKGAKFPDGTNKLKLSNSFRDPTYVREVLSYDIVDNYLVTPKHAFFHLFVNGKDFGVYVGNSSVNKNFLKENFGTKKGNLFKCDPNYDAIVAADCGKDKISNLTFYSDPECYKNLYELKSKKGWNAFEELVEGLNDDQKEIEKELAVFEFLWMHALNSVLVNLDSYTGRLSHNYYLYRDTFDIWHPIMWDLNLSFGGFPFDGEKLGMLTQEELQNHSINVHLQNDTRPLLTKLLLDSENYKLYLHMIHTICEDFFQNGKYKELCKVYQDQIRTVVNSSGKKLYSAKAFEENVKTRVQLGKISMIGIEQLMDQRLDYLKTTRAYEEDLPNYLSHSMSLDSSTWILQCKLLNADHAWLYTQDEEYGPWERKTMTNKLTHWEITLGIEDRPQRFFMRFENSKNASLFPTNAPRQFLTSEKGGFGSNFE